MTSLSIPTVTDLKELFTAHGVRPSRVRGQNFLVDANIMRQVVREAHLEKRDVVLEPGPGTGGLTGLLAEEAGAVVAVELDNKLYELAGQRLAPLTNVRLLHSDILGRGEEVAPDVRQALQSALDALPDSRFKVVSNLPYAVSTAFITAVLLEAPVPCEMVVTVQREVADRLCARPGTEAYGYLSVIVQAVARLEIVRHISPKAFWPQPEVESSIVRLRPDAGLRAAAGDVARLRRVAGALFGHRRKQLARSLVMAGFADNREDAARILSRIGAAESERCEELTVEQFVRLAAPG